MNWRHKAHLQRLLSNVPGGEHVHYSLQRWVTRSLPVTDQSVAASLRTAHWHLELLKPYLDVQLERATFYEFGAGWSLAGPLAFYALGVQRQIVIDIRKLARRRLIAATLAYLHAPTLDLPVVRKPSPSLPENGEWMRHLRAEYGIDYRAPSDARDTRLAPGSIDCITTTATLEHIPREDLRQILRECHRLLRPGGLMSHFVDYKDHYANSDQSISHYNFLQFADGDWERYSPALHYQNRLRHRDYLDLFAEAGFELLTEERSPGTVADRQVLEELDLADRFSAYSLADLAVRHAFVVVRKPAIS